MGQVTRNFGRFSVRSGLRPNAALILVHERERLGGVGRDLTFQRDALAGDDRVEAREPRDAGLAKVLRHGNFPSLSEPCGTCLHLCFDCRETQVVGSIDSRVRRVGSRGLAKFLPPTMGRSSLTGNKRLLPEPLEDDTASPAV